jgi:hypothetical protein
MAHLRGLTTRLCGNCGKMATHKTLYVKTESAGRSKWLRIFWVCLSCNAPNHVVVPRYMLETKPLSPPPAELVEDVTLALECGPLDFDELMQNLRIGRKGICHTFNSDVRMALQYLTANRIVTEHKDDLTDRTITEVSAKSRKANHLKLCPDERSRGVETRGVVSLYAQRHTGMNTRPGTRIVKRWFAHVGLYCIQCGYLSIKLSDFY